MQAVVFGMVADHTVMSRVAGITLIPLLATNRVTGVATGMKRATIVIKETVGNIPQNHNVTQMQMVLVIVPGMMKDHTVIQRVAGLKAPKLTAKDRQVVNGLILDGAMI